MKSYCSRFPVRKVVSETENIDKGLE